MFRMKPNSNVVVCASDPPITPDFEFSTQAPPWIDYFVDDAMGEARAIVTRGESVFLQGFGGTGRTYATRAIVTELLEQKKKRDLHLLYPHGQPKHRCSGSLQRHSSSRFAQNSHSEVS